MCFKFIAQDLQHGEKKNKSESCEIPKFQV